MFLYHAAILLVRVESLQFLQKDVAVRDSVVLVRHNEKLEDGPSARSKEYNSTVPVRPSLCIHHYLIQLVPEPQSRETKYCINAMK